jgi:hypothetical protein
MKLPEQQINLFAVRNSETLFFYVLTNRRLINNMQSTLEIEVWKWVDNNLQVHQPRMYLPFYISDSEGKRPTEQVFYEFPADEK